MSEDPRRSNKCLVIPALIQKALKSFSPSVMRAAFEISFCEVQSGCKVERVPSATAYHVELYAVLRSLLPHRIKIAFDLYPLGSDNGHSCFLVLQNDQRRYILGMVSSANKATIQLHLHRIRLYGRAMFAYEGWLIYFTCLARTDLHVFHNMPALIIVWHNLSWTHVVMYWGRECVKVL